MGKKGGVRKWLITIYLTVTFQHSNIMKFCPNTRKFNSGNEMDEFMVEEWNSIVTDKDIVYHLGDFSFGRETSFDNAVKIFKRLKGHKNLIIGNHESYGMKLPWESMMNYRKIKDNGKSIVLMHYPIEDWDGRYKETIHFHGHVHSSKDVPYRFVRNRYDVGVDNIGFKPLTCEQIISLHKEWYPNVY